MGNVLHNRDYAAHNLRSHTQQLPLQIDLTIRYTNQLKPDFGGIVPYSILPDNRSFSCFPSCNGWNYSSDAGPSIIQHVTGSSSNITPYRLPVPSTLVQVSIATPLATSITNTNIVISNKEHDNSQHTSPSNRCNQLTCSFYFKIYSGNNDQKLLWLWGCYQTKNSNSSPPPHDLVIRYKEQRHYRDHITKELKYTAAAENIHYHFTLSCVQKKHPSFQPAKLIIPRDYYTLNYCNSWTTFTILVCTFSLQHVVFIQE